MDYLAMQSCTSGRNAFFTGMYPLRTGMIPPQLPGSPSFLQPGTPAVAKFLHDLGYTTGEFGKNHLGDKTAALPTAHGFEEYWGYLYHLDAMQQVSFPDINSSTTVQGIAPPCKNTPIPGIAEVPGAVDPMTTTCLTPPRNVLWCHSSDGTEANQSCKDEGPLTLDRSRTVDEEISGQGHRLPRPQRPEEDQQAVLRLVQPGPHACHDHAAAEIRGDDRPAGGKDWGLNEAGMKQLDDNIGYVIKKLEDMGQLDNTIVVFTTDNGAETVSFPDGGITPFKGQKGEAWEGGYRSPQVVRWPGHIKPGTVKNQMFAALDWLPTLVDIAGGPKGDELKKQIEAGSYPGIVKTTLDGFDQRDYLEGKSDKSAQRRLLLLLGRDAVRRALQELEDVLLDGAWGSGRLVLAACQLSLDPGRERQARSVRAGRRLRGRKVSHGAGRHARLPIDRLFVRLEHAADRPAAVGAGTGVLREVPAAATAGDLQPERHSAGDEGA